jgi:peptide/nickel transport system permease protein
MAVAEPFAPQVQVRGPVRRVGRARVRRTSLSNLVGMGAFAAVILIGLLAPVLAPNNPIVPGSQMPFTPPFHAGALLGTDEVGFDILSRVLYGLRASLLAALVVIASGVIVGGAIGLAAGAMGGWLDDFLMRTTDLFLALPGPVLAIAVVAALGPGYWHTLLAIALVWWPFYARIVRGEVRALASRPHLEAARLAGANGWRRASRHLFPGAVPAVLVTASLDVSNLVITLALLSFLGLGAPQPAPELGAMAARGLQYLLQEWWVPVMPAFMVFLLAFTANLAGDGLRDLMGDR